MLIVKYRNYIDAFIEKKIPYIRRRCLQMTIFDFLNSFFFRYKFKLMLVFNTKIKVDLNEINNDLNEIRGFAFPT